MIVVRGVLIVVMMSAVVTAGEGTLPVATERAVDFQKDVQPILFARCLKCHGPEKQESGLRVDRKASLLRGGDFGEPSVLVGKSAVSFLIQVVAGLHDDLIMPPTGERLTPNEIGILRAWIDQGFLWPAEHAADESTVTTDHWSFQPLTASLLPTSGGNWSVNPIDRFVYQQQQRAGLLPSPSSDRVNLIRRLSLVMLGLPPSSAEVTDFVNDPRIDAYERLVDRALASPRYGERWARHWLDVVRFAESHGFETNQERPNAWPFRDYVIEALNADKPYDQFIQQQIAGDQLGYDAATGFLVGGPYDLVKSPDINLTLMQRQNELADIVNTTGTTFLALTLGCARCHNHKFDPILQKDYYALQAVFAGVTHAERALAILPSQTKEVAELSARIVELTNKLEKFVAHTVQKYIFIEDNPPAEHGGRGLVELVPAAGEGRNPPGKGRGQLSDPGSDIHTHNASDGKYTWWSDAKGQAVAAYQLRARGRFRIWLSWGTGHPTHVTDAVYVLDLDGDLNTSSDQRKLATVNQLKFSNGDDGQFNQALWSGFYFAGVHGLKPRSKIVLYAGHNGVATTSDVVLLESVSGESVSEIANSNVANTGDAKETVLPSFRSSVNAQHNYEQLEPVLAQRVRFEILASSSGEPCIDELEIFSAGMNVALASRGAIATSSGNFSGNAFHKLEHLNDGQVGNSHSWISNENGRGWVQIELAEPTLIDRIEWSRDRESQYADRVATKYQIEVAPAVGDWTMVASSDDRLPYTPSAPRGPSYHFAGFPQEVAAQGRIWARELRAVKSRHSALSKPRMIYAGMFQQPGPTHRLFRGDPLAKREVVAPDALTVLGSLGLALDEPEPSRRQKLAAWIASSENPLTSRVLVNRVWHYIFGTGIVATPSDFGANGGLPSHRELLDRLAIDFVTGGWSIKRLQRQILNSQTFQQSSDPRVEALAQDADCRWLWRFPPRRLEAEAIRDSILAVSGNLRLEMGGPGYSLFDIQLEGVRHFFPKTEFGPAEWRRMIYVMKFRQEQDDVFGAFDCPDGNQTVPLRPVSTTPLQALNLLNSGFVLQQSNRLASRLQSECGDNVPAQLRRLFQDVFNRSPLDPELADCLAFVETFGLPALCRAIINTNEFVFIP